MVGTPLRDRWRASAPSWGGTSRQGSLEATRSVSAARCKSRTSSPSRLPTAVRFRAPEEHPLPGARRSVGCGCDVFGLGRGAPVAPRPLRARRLVGRLSPRRAPRRASRRTSWTAASTSGSSTCERARRSMLRSDLTTWTTSPDTTIPPRSSTSSARPATPRRTSSPTESAESRCSCRSWGATAKGSSDRPSASRPRCTSGRSTRRFSARPRR